jgi:hypothetical protein
MTRTGRRTIWAAIGACLALLVGAAVVLAATPAPGTYEGKTGQKKLVRVKVNSQHRVHKFRINWKAPCDSGDAWPGGTVDIDGSGDKIKQDTDAGTFHDAGSYVPDKQNGYTGHVTVSFNGTFTKATKAEGKFKVKVRVSKNGETVDHCRKTVGWKVSG